MSPITGYVSGCLGSVAPTILDPATLAWVAAVVTNGGTVSGTREGIVNSLIVGLKSDGVFSKLDRLWLFAGENTPSALTDIITDSLATAVNSPTFTTDQGYTGNGTSSYVDSNVSQTASGLNYAQNSACLFGWNNSSGHVDAAPICALAGGTGVTRIYPQFTDNKMHFGCNGDSGIFPASTGAVGLYLCSRTASNVQTPAINGVDQGTDNVVSSALQNNDFVALQEFTTSFSTYQCSVFGFGGALTGTDRGNLYTRLRTYATAIGLP